MQVGVIGAGVMGSDHARLFATAIRGAELAGVADPDRARAQAAAGGAAAFTDSFDLIASDTVDAVVVASPDQTHKDIVLACLAAGKPVLCEKPLAMTSVECLTVVEAEQATGRRLVQVGFMRRFDPAYCALKAELDMGVLGVPRIVHNLHRNATAPEWFTPGMAITNAAVHEFDTCRWLLGTEYTNGRVLVAPKAEDVPAGDPLLITLETEQGALVSTEVFMNATYGYHVHCEIVGTQGSAAMAHPDSIRLRKDRAEQGRFPENWIPRFAEAYRLQDQAWIDAIQGRGVNQGANAWDAYVATWLAERLLDAIQSGATVDLTLPPRPGAA